MTSDTYREISSPEIAETKPLVSIYVATYRHEKYLTQAVESIVAQKLDFPIEIVIGEDHSPDGTLAVAIELQRRHPDKVRVIAGDGNVGGLRNSTRCLALCRGDFIAYCEGDDYWHDLRKLQSQIDIMTADPQVVLCHSDYDRLIGTRIKRSMHARYPSPFLARGASYIPLLHEWTVMTVTCVYRASLIRDFLRTPFNRLDWPFGDYPKALYASTQGTVAYLPRSTGTWRKVRGSLSNAGFPAILRLRIADVECKQVFMAAFPVDDQIRRSVLDRAQRIIMRDAFNVGDVEAYRAAMSRCSPTARRPIFDAVRMMGLHLRFPVVITRAYRNLILRLTAHGF
ncbi:glycosyltransferase [Luteibacter sp.]|jgi:hypothetical protein|uniref:glycosyltransferase n=1 Tax=Luteibacter sp. TaxID=1886636 RepID=UPI002F42BBB3